MSITIIIVNNINNNNSISNNNNSIVDGNNWVRAVPENTLGAESFAKSFAGKKVQAIFSISYREWQNDTCFVRKKHLGEFNYYFRKYIDFSAENYSF